MISQLQHFSGKFVSFRISSDTMCSQFRIAIGSIEPAKRNSRILMLNLFPNLRSRRVRPCTATSLWKFHTASSSIHCDVLWSSRCTPESFIHGLGGGGGGQQQPLKETLTFIIKLSLIFVDMGLVLLIALCTRIQRDESGVYGTLNSTVEI